MDDPDPEAWFWAQMGRLTRRAVAWVVVLALVGLGMLDGLQALSWASGRATGATDHGQVFEQLHGEVVAMRDDSAFALRVVDRRTGRASVVWVQLMPDSHVSMAHLRRHLRDHAGTDVEVRPGERKGDMPQVVAAD